MDENLSKLLAVNADEEYSTVPGGEYLFHAALEGSVLSQVLAKFPRSETVETFVQENVLRISPLQDGWQDDLLADLRALMTLLPSDTLAPVTQIKQAAKIDYDTDEMFTLRATMGRTLRRETSGILTPHEMAFLNDFFYGIDFTHWTKWAVLLCYTNRKMQIPTILRARRNDVEFGIMGDTLLYKLAPKASSETLYS